MRIPADEIPQYQLRGTFSPWTKSAVICERHFTDDSFMYYAAGLKKLKSTAIPTRLARSPLVWNWEMARKTKSREGVQQACVVCHERYPKSVGVFQWPNWDAEQCYVWRQRMRVPAAEIPPYVTHLPHRTKSAFICEHHFTGDSFVHTAAGSKRLVSTAIPTRLARPSEGFPANVPPADLESPGSVFLKRPRYTSAASPNRCLARRRQIPTATHGSAESVCLGIHPADGASRTTSVAPPADSPSDRSLSPPPTNGTNSQVTVVWWRL